jgi:hypothetical protein
MVAIDYRAQPGAVQLGFFHPREIPVLVIVPNP